MVLLKQFSVDKGDMDSLIKSTLNSTRDPAQPVSTENCEWNTTLIYASAAVKCFEIIVYSKCVLASMHKSLQEYTASA